jgi:hypothetical protein
VEARPSGRPEEETQLTERTRSAIRWASFATGVVIALAVLAAYRVPPGGAALGAEVRVAATPSGELEVSSNAPFVVATGLHPDGARRSGEVEVRNSAGRALAFRVRALPSIRDLDRSLVVSVEADGKTIYTGPLGGLRRWSHRSFRLRSGDAAEIGVQVGLPRGARGYRGRIADATLEFGIAATKPEGG